jgi:hypothetical protein
MFTNLTITKEFRKRSPDSIGLVVITANTYASSLAFLDWLFAEAQRDFPDLKREEVEVKYYAGARRARTFGLEFNRPAAPDFYERIYEVERTF